MGDVQCGYHIQSVASGESTQIRRPLQGPDVTGDGAPDVLFPLALEVTYNGTSEQACRELLARDFSATFAQNVTGASGVFRAHVYQLGGISTQGMENKSGASWESFQNTTAFTTRIPGIMLSLLGDFPDLSLIAYTGELEDAHETHASQSSDHTTITRDDDGGVSVDSERKTFWQSEQTGTGKRSAVTADTIANSQLQYALAIPYDGAELRIGTAVAVNFQTGLPQEIQKKTHRDKNDTSFEGRVIGFSSVRYEKINDQYRVMPNAIKLQIAPKGDADITHAVELPLQSDAGEYTIRVIK